MAVKTETEAVVQQPGRRMGVARSNFSRILYDFSFKEIFNETIPPMWKLSKHVRKCFTVNYLVYGL